MWKTRNSEESADGVSIFYLSIEISWLTLMGVYPHSARKSVSGQDLAHRKGVNPQAFPQQKKLAV
jgi:hypothetical protein